jgi:hypothetical protein
MIAAMKRQEFELDVYNRQRNIVFPDTVLNEGRFYRTIFSSNAQFTRGQRIALVVYGLCIMILGCIWAAGDVTWFLRHLNSQGAIVYLEIYPILFAIGTVILGGALIFRGLFPPRVTRLMRLREYRRWPRG